MAQHERVRALAEQGFYASQIARELGVSPQRVGQIIKKHDIPVTNGWMASRPAPSAPTTKAPCITGGIERPASATIVGLAAEALVEADLISRGWQVYAPRRRNLGHDLVIWKDGKLVTVEVRSARKRVDGSIYYNTGKGGRDSDMFAIVMTGEPIRYKPSGIID